MSPLQAPTAQSDGSLMTDKVTEVLVPDTYTLQWQLEIVNGTEFIRFTVVCAASGWVGLGFAKGTRSASEASQVLGLNVFNAQMPQVLWWKQTL